MFSIIAVLVGNADPAGWHPLFSSPWPPFPFFSNRWVRRTGGAHSKDIHQYYCWDYKLPLNPTLTLKKETLDFPKRVKLASVNTFHNLATCYTGPINCSIYLSIRVSWYCNVYCLMIGCYEIWLWYWDFVDHLLMFVNKALYILFTTHLFDQFLCLKCPTGFNPFVCTYIGMWQTMAATH